MRGRFIFNPGTPEEIKIWNTIVDEGEEAMLKMLLHDDQTIVAGASDFYVGLCGADFNEESTLLSLSAGEPTVGYARQPAERSSAGWPVVTQVGQSFVARTAVLTFTATGDWDVPVIRAFLCNVVSGTAGVLFGVSGALPASIQLLNGASRTVQYEFYLR